MAKKIATPGPWMVRPHWANKGEYEVYPARKGETPQVGDWAEIAEVKSGSDDESARRNAMLMAAAPDLLDACERLLVCMKLAGWEGDDAAVTARKAIAKANRK